MSRKLLECQNGVSSCLGAAEAVNSGALLLSIGAHYSASGTKTLFQVLPTKFLTMEIRLRFTVGSYSMRQLYIQYSRSEMTCTAIEKDVHHES